MKRKVLIIYLCMALKNDIHKLQAIVSAVNDLVRKNIMQEFTDIPHVYVIRSILQLQDSKYMKNWCQNILRVWVLTFKTESIDSVELVVFDKDNGDLICRFSEKNGLSFG